MYRTITEQYDVDPFIWFQTMADNRGYGIGTRHVTGLNDVIPQESHSQARNDIFSQRMVAPWNVLPNWVKQSTTVNMFKNRLDGHIQQGLFLSYYAVLLTEDNPIYGKKAPGITFHVQFPGAFLNKCSVWSFWGYLFCMRLVSTSSKDNTIKAIVMEEKVRVNI